MPGFGSQPAPAEPSSHGESREAARTPDDLGRLFVARAGIGDVEGVVALYEPDAVLALRDGSSARGVEAIRDAYTKLLAARSDFRILDQPAALVLGDLALTSSRTPGAVTAEVARRQQDGTWLWVLDRPDVAGRVAEHESGQGASDMGVDSQSLRYLAAD